MVLLFVVVVSVLSLVLLLLRWALLSGEWARLAMQVVALSVVCAVLYTALSIDSDIVRKGPERTEILIAVALYICMLAGMLAQYLHRRFERPKRRRKNFDWGVFLAPIFASPIVFIPILIAFQHAQLDLSEQTSARLMVFLIAFQNGFFWKEYFDHRQRDVAQNAE